MGSIVLFDGVCNFCSDWVNFVIRHDSADRFRFAPLQSEVGRELLERYAIDDELDSLVLIEDSRVFTRSTGALKIAKSLDAPWSFAYYLIYIPAPIRDFFYSLFAKYRYSLFGQKEVCMMPTPGLRTKFLSEPPASAGGKL